MFTKVIHDSLYAKALAFDNGKQRFVFIVVDCTAIDGELLDETKKILKKSLGLYSGQIMISSTHAHSCGAVMRLVSCPADLLYRLAKPQKIANAAIVAFNNLQPAKIGWGHIDVPKHVSCRRWYMKPGFNTISPFGDTDKVWMNPPKGSEFNDRPVSPTDPQVSYLAVKNINGSWLSIMANYSTHYVADIPENTISADYFGELHNRLQNKLGADESFVGIMTNGTSGDVNTFDFKLEKNYPAGPFQKTNLIANDIADSIVHTIKSIKWQTNPLFKFGYKEVKTAGRPIPAELLAQCKKLVVGTDFNSISSIDKASDAVARLSALCVVELDEYKKPFLNIPFHAI